VQFCGLFIVSSGPQLAYIFIIPSVTKIDYVWNLLLKYKTYDRLQIDKLVYIVL